MTPHRDGIIVAIMITPIITAISRDILLTVPRPQIEGMLALGATKWEAIWQVALPYARVGLFGAVILGLGRAIGETMAVTMVIGNRNALFSSLLAPGNTIPSVLANETYEASGLHLSALFALGVILFFVALSVNIGARLLVRRMVRSGGGH